MGASATSGAPLHARIGMGMAVGASLGLLARLALPGSPAVGWTVQNLAMPIGQVFLRMIFMVVVPLVVAALALGVAEIGDIRRMRRIGGKLLGFTLLFTGLAVAVGVLAVNAFQPGVGLSPVSHAALMATIPTAEVGAHLANASHAKGFAQTLLEVIPKNPFVEAVNAFDGGLLPLMFFALMIGLALMTLEASLAAPLKRLLESVYAVTLAIIGFAMRLAPLGVAALMFSVVATTGAEALWMLGKYALVVLGALAFQLFVVYGSAVQLLAGRGPRAFWGQCREAMLTAFSTSSSAATLPTALQTASEKLKLPREVGSFVLTVGSTLNHHGTALYEGTTVLFLAQFFGVHLTLLQQITVACTAVVMGIGTAGVPGGSLPMIVVILHSIGVPGEAIGIIIGIDRVLDMARTTLNVTGDLAIATIIAAGEPHEGRSSDPALHDAPHAA